MFSFATPQSAGGPSTTWELILVVTSFCVTVCIQLISLLIHDWGVRFDNGAPLATACLPAPVRAKSMLCLTRPQPNYCLCTKEGCLGERAVYVGADPDYFGLQLLPGNTSQPISKTGHKMETSPAMSQFQMMLCSTAVGHCLECGRDSV